MLKAYSRAVARINSLRTDEEGATATEYALIIGVASIAIVAALVLIAPAIANFVQHRHRHRALVRCRSSSTIVRAGRALDGRGRRVLVKDGAADDPTSVENVAQRRSSSHSSLPLLLVVLFALVDLGWVFNQQLAVSSAAREGVRYYANPSRATPAPARVAEARSRAAEPGRRRRSRSPSSHRARGRRCDQLTVLRENSDHRPDRLRSGLAAGTTLAAKGTMRCGG